MSFWSNVDRPMRYTLVIAVLFTAVVVALGGWIKYSAAPFVAELENKVSAANSNENCSYLTDGIRREGRCATINFLKKDYVVFRTGEDWRLFSAPLKDDPKVLVRGHKDDNGGFFEFNMENFVTTAIGESKR